MSPPWVFYYQATGTPATLNSVYLGVLIAIFAAIRLASLRATAGLSWVNLILALWTIASPWVYGYSANVGGVRDNVILGVVIAVLAIWSWSATIAEQKHRPDASAHFRAQLR